MKKLYQFTILLLPFVFFAQRGASQEIPLQAGPNNALPSPEIPRNSDNAPSFSEIWQVLGPFQIGTRGKTTIRLCIYMITEIFKQRRVGGPIR